MEATVQESPYAGSDLLQLRQNDDLARGPVWGS
jgi:hypothetical protein